MNDENCILIDGERHHLVCEVYMSLLGSTAAIELDGMTEISRTHYYLVHWSGLVLHESVNH